MIPKEPQFVCGFFLQYIWLMYFQAPYEVENIKKQFRELSKTLHPDKGGSETEFKLMKHEYDVLLKLITNTSKENKKRVVIKVVKPKRMHYHFTTDKNTIDLLKNLKKIFK